MPGASILEGALSFGASILNPETTLEDLQKGLVEVKESCEGTQAALKSLLLREKERAIAFANTEAEMRDKLNQTYNLMVDSRFRVSPKKT